MIFSGTTHIATNEEAKKIYDNVDKYINLFEDEVDNIQNEIEKGIRDNGERKAYLEELNTCLEKLRKLK